MNNGWRQQSVFNTMVTRNKQTVTPTTPYCWPRVILGGVWLLFDYGWPLPLLCRWVLIKIELSNNRKMLYPCGDAYGDQARRRAYRIRPNFRGAQFSRIAISKHFVETIFADQEFRVYGILKFRQLNFRGLLATGSAKTAKITCLENLHLYDILSYLHRVNDRYGL